MTEPPRAPAGFSADFLTQLFRFPLDPGYVDAAEARDSRGPRPAGRALALQITAAVTSLAIGLLFAVAYRKTQAEEPERARARAGLVSQIQKLRAGTDRKQALATKLREDVSRLRDAQLGDAAVAELRTVENAAGVTRVRGDGVVITVTDAVDTADPVTGNTATNELNRVHDADLRQLANDLWYAGAEAIEIGGQRLTATSTIRNAGDHIQVDAKPIPSPYRIVAIGPSDLRDAFAQTTAARLFEGLHKRYKIGYTLRAVDDLTMSAAADPELRTAHQPRAVPPSPSAVAPTARPTDSPGGGR